MAAERARKQSRLGLLAALLSVLSLVSAISLVVFSELRLENAVSPHPVMIREQLAEWATWLTMSLGPAGALLGLASLATKNVSHSWSKLAIFLGLCVSLPILGHQALGLLGLHL